MRKGPLTSTKPLATKPKPTVTKPGPTSTTVKKPVARVPLYQNGVKPKYEAFSDLLHPSERFGTKIEDMEYTRSKNLGELNDKIGHQKAIANHNTRGNSHAMANLDGMEIVSNSMSSYELFNTPHNYVRIQIQKPALKARETPTGYGNPGAMGMNQPAPNGPSYRRKF